MPCVGTIDSTDCMLRLVAGLVDGFEPFLALPATTHG